MMMIRGDVDGRDAIARSARFGIPAHGNAIHRTESERDNSFRYSAPQRHREQDEIHSIIEKLWGFSNMSFQLSLRLTSHLAFKNADQTL